MPPLRDVFLRESILKALSAAGGGLTPDELDARVEKRLHSMVFPRGSEGDTPRYRDELLAQGLLVLRDGRYHRVSALDGDWMLAQWFEALGGVTPIDDLLYRSPLPYTEAHFEELRAAQIRVVYSFEESAPGAAIRAAGLDWRPHFWLDNGRPSHEEMDMFLADVAALPQGTRVVVHCKAGIGRAGMAAACALAARHGWDATRALEHYWQRVPLAREVMEEYGQADFVRAHVKRAQR